MELFAPPECSQTPRRKRPSRDRVSPHPQQAVVWSSACSLVHRLAILPQPRQMTLQIQVPGQVPGTSMSCPTASLLSPQTHSSFSYKLLLQPSYEVQACQSPYHNLSAGSPLENSNVPLFFPPNALCVPLQGRGSNLQATKGELPQEDF